MRIRTAPATGLGAAAAAVVAALLAAGSADLTRRAASADAKFADHLLSLY
ncbi:MAG: hypothetical protein KDB70_15460 [Mycobacterium sp.]|nr:hypothetical protein [Mycobacterium sp.]